MKNPNKLLKKTLLVELNCQFLISKSCVNYLMNDYGVQSNGICNSEIKNSHLV